ncbi:MAG TPA: glycosyltransferase family 39 protein, partial [Candidatus Kapabacteria bacterium]|nr:glycosyltransferase family 39 protein [Candidatus Kapabacteria bacterium]
MAWLSHFAMLSNDVFPLRWQAEHLSLHHPETFYDGFFPIGYPLLLRLASLTGNPVLTLMLLQIAVAVLYVLVARRVLQMVLDPEAALLALPLVLFVPQIAGNVLSVTPDFAAALCSLAAFFFIAHASRMVQNTRRYIFFAGVSMGIGYLFRTHIIVLSLSCALALLIFEDGRRLRAALWFCAGVTPFVFMQGLLQIWSGHGFFENAQAFNIWRTMYGMDWNNPVAIGGMTAFDVIRENPRVFFAAYWGAIVQGSLYILPSLIALI